MIAKHKEEEEIGGSVQERFQKSQQQAVNNIAKEAKIPSMRSDAKEKGGVAWTGLVTASPCSAFPTPRFDESANGDPVNTNTTESQPWRESSAEKEEETSSESSEESIANQEPNTYDPDLSLETVETTNRRTADTMASRHAPTTPGAGPSTTVHYAPPALKIPDPDRFKEEPLKAKTFIGQVQAKLEGAGPFTDAAQISYATALLTDRAAEWLGSYMSLEGRHTFTSFHDFLTKFKQQFIDPNPRATAMKKLMETKQGSDDIQTYFMKMTSLVNDSDIGDIGGKAIVQAHMNPRSRMALIYSTSRMSETELMNETIEEILREGWTTHPSYRERVFLLGS
ncbi:MAG: hypothetical protein M1816_005911 [Peltula sp. TS41687]|nr:MAG: hypothetical protein M1816_005911 [Peltula sp. TS41687]